MDEIRELADNGTRIIRFEDDTFTTNRTRLHELSESVVAAGLHRRVQFSCWARANEMTADVARSLKAMNTSLVWMGLESGSQRTLDYLKGHVTVEQSSRAIDMLKDAGVRVNGFFVIGSPHETEDDIAETVEFIKKSRLDFITLNILTPVPGTAIWEQWTTKNPVPAAMDWSKLFSNDPYTSPIVSEELSREDLYRHLKKFARLSRSMKIRAHLGKLRFSEVPRIAHYILSSAGLYWRRLTQPE
jgi:anaerobic magnesium-protoporphyrin IX monomethyl ester cyclase